MPKAIKIRKNKVFFRNSNHGYISLQHAYRMPKSIKIRTNKVFFRNSNHGYQLPQHAYRMPKAINYSAFNSCKTNLLIYNHQSAWSAEFILLHSQRETLNINYIFARLKATISIFQNLFWEESDIIHLTIHSIWLIPMTHGKWVHKYLYIQIKIQYRKECWKTHFYQTLHIH